MSDQYRDIRKEVNLTADELKQIEKMMEVDKKIHDRFTHKGGASKAKLGKK